MDTPVLVYMGGKWVVSKTEGWGREIVSQRDGMGGSTRCRKGITTAYGRRDSICWTGENIYNGMGCAV